MQIQSHGLNAAEAAIQPALVHGGPTYINNQISLFGTLEDP